MADNQCGESGAEESARCLHHAVRKAAMTAWHNILGDLKEPSDPDQQHKNWEPMLWIAEAIGGSDGRKGQEPLQAGWSACDEPKFDRRKGEDRNGE